MERDWLVRTSRNQILGPISKQKLMELLDKGSLTAEDEVCSGNGYWFRIREKDLVQNYIHGSYKQEFNSICEAKNVQALPELIQKFADSNRSNYEILRDEGKVRIPSDDDLAFPDVEPLPYQVDQSDFDLPDITKIGVLTSAPPPVGVESSRPNPIVGQKPVEFRPYNQKEKEKEDQFTEHLERDEKPVKSKSVELKSNVQKRIDEISFGPLEQINTLEIKSSHQVEAPHKEVLQSSNENGQSVFEEIPEPRETSEVVAKSSRKSEMRSASEKVRGRVANSPTEQSSRSTRQNNKPNDRYLFVVLVFLFFGFIALYHHYRKVVRIDNIATEEVNGESYEMPSDIPTENSETEVPATEQ